jgi:hypothetical protein
MIVEILDRRAAVRQRVRLVAFPANFGRGYQNDVVLDDRYVDPLHARLGWDGAGSLVLTDLRSVNGIIDPATGRRAAEVPIRSGTEVRLGRTTLRFIDPAHPVEPALVESPAPGHRWIGDSPVRDLGIALGTGLLLGFNDFLDATERVRVPGLLGEALTSLLLVAAWAGVWAMVNRITRNRFRFSEHFVIPCAAISAYTIFNAGAGYLRFLFPGPVDWEMGGGAVAIVVAILALSAHLARVSLLPAGKRLLWSTGVILTLALIVTLSDHGDRSEFGSRLEDTPLKPLGPALIPSITPTRFLKQVDELQDEVDELAEKMAEREKTHGE